LFEPMAELWLPRLLVKALGTLMPVGLVTLLRPALKRLVLAGMHEEVQRARAELVIDSADLRKWRRAALRLADWHIRDIAPHVHEPVAVIQASGDRFHDESVFPGIAGALPAGQLYRLPVPESNREHLMGRVASVYAHGGTAADLIPGEPGPAANLTPPAENPRRQPRRPPRARGDSPDTARE
ncbi:MAG: hypothetical protein R6W94_07890, partial [Spirochaetia bacterium]